VDKRFELAVFVVASLGLIYISRRSLLRPRSHGFFRFFAWEFILALILLKLDAWFLAPASPHQVVSWVLLLASLVPLVLGVRALASHGLPAGQRKGEEELLAFEKTSQLVTTGIYRYIRHPLYSSLLLLAWGAFFKGPDGTGAALALAATLALIATARADEAECLRFFGADYQTYMRRTKMFLPFVI